MKTRTQDYKNELRTQVKGIVLLTIAVFCYAGLQLTPQTGELGLFVHNVLRTMAGETAVVIPFLIGIYALKVMLPQKILGMKTRLTGILILLLLFMVSAHFQLMITQAGALQGQDFYRSSLEMGYRHHLGGGIVGAIFAIILFFCFRDVGSYIILGALALIAVLLVTCVSLNQVLNGLKKTVLLALHLCKKLGLFMKETYVVLMAASEEEEEEEEEERATAGHARKTGREKIAAHPEEHEIPTISVAQPAINPGPDPKARRDPERSDGELPPARSRGADLFSGPATESGPASTYQQEYRLSLVEPPAGGKSVAERGRTAVVTPSPGAATPMGTGGEYILPPLDLLARANRPGESQQIKGIKDRARLLENTLHSFGVKARVIHVQSGPTVTRFEVQPEAGVKVSRIVSLSDDLALNLAAPLVRIEAPIPGKAALGIEVPNKIISLVYLREVLESVDFREHASPLTAGLGKDITGVPVIADLTRMPHLLIAGATGSGKSVCLNTIITSILYKSGPDRVRFLMIDPKVVELNSYNGIPHLLLPVVTEPKKASLALRNMVREMTRRYELFARERVREITAYNKLVASNPEKGETLPYIVIIVDELADLMMVSPGEVEDAICRLAQMSRAAGIHLIIATQRPSVDILTGVIKANITSRIAFTVSSQVDSRTILDMAGAEKLLGRGDMLFFPVGMVKPIRVQGAYISEREINSIAAFARTQGEARYEEHLVPAETEEEFDEVDELFPDAVELVVRTGQASISLLQRRFRIGYTRAARLIDDLERRGVVGQFEGSKPREVVITPEQAARMYEDFKQKLEH